MSTELYERLGRAVRRTVVEVLTDETGSEPRVATSINAVQETFSTQATVRENGNSGDVFVIDVAKVD